MFYCEKHSSLSGHTIRDEEKFYYIDIRTDTPVYWGNYFCEIVFSVSNWQKVQLNTDLFSIDNCYCLYYTPVL